MSLGIRKRSLRYVIANLGPFFGVSSQTDYIKAQLGIIPDEGEGTEYDITKTLSPTAPPDEIKSVEQKMSQLRAGAAKLLAGGSYSTAFSDIDPRGIAQAALNLSLIHI